MLIEIIGLPGSGKSTLLKMLLENKNIHSSLQTWDNIKIKAIYNFLETSSTELKGYTRLHWKLLWNIPYVNQYFSDYFLQKKIKFSPEIYKSNWGIVAGYVMKGIIERPSLCENMKPHYLSWELEKITRNRLIKSYVKKQNKHILLDEGILTTISTINIDGNLKDIIKPDILPDAVIYLKTNIELVFNTALVRRSNGGLLQMKDKKDDEIFEFIVNKQIKYEKIVDYLTNINIPVIQFDREVESVDHVIDMIIGIIS